MVKISARLLGRRIRWLRTREGLSVSELASKIGVDPSWMSRLEWGRRDATIDQLCALSSLFGISIDGLINANSTEWEKHTLRIIRKEMFSEHA